MNTLINKTTSALSSVVLFACGCVMAGLGLAVVGVLAVFAFAAIGLALLASPFVALAQAPQSETEETINATATA